MSFNIGFDLDYVVIDTTKTYEKFFFDKYGVNIDVLKLNKFGIKIDGVSDKQIYDDIHEAILSNIENEESIKGSIYAIKRIFQMCKTEIRFITARPIHLFNGTYKWLRKNLDVPFSLHMTSYEPKCEIIKDLKLDYFVDDRLKELVDCHDILKMAFLFNQSWNANEKIPDDMNIERVYSLHDLLDIIKP